MLNSMICIWTRLPRLWSTSAEGACVFREPRSERSYRVDHAESNPSRVRSFCHQHRYYPDHCNDLDKDDEMPFSDYIISVKLPRGFKPPIDMEPYDGSSDQQEHMDVFKFRMTLAGVSDPMRCRAFPIMLKKAALKCFNSLPSRSISKFSDLQFRFLAHFTTRRFKPKLVTSFLGLSQKQGEPLRDFLEWFNVKTLLVKELET